MDSLWVEAMAELEEFDLLEQAYQLGELAAWQRNKVEATGVEGVSERCRIDDAYERVDRIADVLGEPARERFAAGFDEAIDFSLNPDWRPVQPSKRKNTA